jgi:hypothetical protein
MLANARWRLVAERAFVRGRKTADPSASLGMTKRGGRLTRRERLLKGRVLVRAQVVRAGILRKI